MSTNQMVNDPIFNKEVEIQRLSWFDALFTTIKNDLEYNTVGSTHKAQHLADLGQYLAQDLQHYSEGELTALQAEQGADNE